MSKPQPQSNIPPLATFYTELEGLECRFIRLREYDKLPAGHWQDAPGLAIDEAIPVLGGMDNTGIVPGPRVVLADVDTGEGLEKFQAAMPGLTPNGKTPRGWHFWLVCPEGYTIEKLGIEQGAGKTTLGPGIDTRTPGKGYGVGPGSVLNEKAYGKNPPPGGPEWAYELTGPIHYVSAESLAVLRKPTPPAKSKPQAKEKAPAKGKPQAKRNTGKVAALPGVYAIKEGGRNDAINRLAFQLASCYPRVSPEALRAEMDAVREQSIDPAGEPYTDKEYEATLKSAFDAAAEVSDAQDPHINNENTAGAFHEPSGNPVDDFHRQLEALGVEVCFNVRARRIEFRFPDGPWLDEQDERDLLQTRLALLSPPRPKLDGQAENVAWDFPQARRLGKDEFDRYISAAGAFNHRDHWWEELKALRRKREGQGEGDAALLHEFMLTWYYIPEGYEHPASWSPANTLVGAIKRACFAGAKHDLTSVLISPKQGLVKSSIFRELLGPHLFSSGVRLTGIKDPRQAFEQTAGVAVAEIADMRGLRGAASEEALPALSETHSAPVREAYGKKGEAKAMPYRHVWLVTTNREDCISTINGENRRLLPLMLDELRDDPNLASLPQALQEKLSGIDDPAMRMVTALRDPEYKAALLHGAIFLALDGAADPDNGDFSGSRYEREYPRLELSARELTERHQYHDDIHERIITEWARAERAQDPAWLGGREGDCIAWMHREKNNTGPGGENHEHFYALLNNPDKLQSVLKLTLARKWGPLAQPIQPDGSRPRIYTPPDKL